MPDTKYIEVSFADYNGKTDRIRQLEAEVQSDRQLQIADATTINKQTGKIQRLEKALQSIANLWPEPDCCAELVPEWVGENDGRMRAVTLWYALNSARKALGLAEYPRPEHWDKKPQAIEEEP